MGAANNTNLMYRVKVSEEGAMEFGPLTRKRIKAECKQFHGGKRVVLVVKRDRKLKSVLQLGYYYAVIVPYVMYGLIKLGNAFQIGNDQHEDEIDKWLKERFLKNGDAILGDGAELLGYTPASLARATTTDAMDFYAEIIKWALEDLGVNIPEPDTDWKHNSDGASCKDLLMEKLLHENPQIIKEWEKQRNR